MIGAVPAYESKVQEWLDWLCLLFTQADIYFGHGTDNAADEAGSLLFGLLRIDPIERPRQMQEKLPAASVDQLLGCSYQRIVNRVPVPYLTGIAWFLQRPYQVDTNVLIPRSPIGELIEQGFWPWLRLQPPARILDLCAGSGCLGISCAHQFPDATVDLVDISKAANVVSQANIALHELGDRVAVVTSDLWAGLEGRQYDLIVTNPPYVNADDLATRPPEYHHEPLMALEAGQDGLFYAHKILAQAADFLLPSGLLVMELGNSSQALLAAYPQLPFIEVDLVKGGHGVLILEACALILSAPQS